MPDSRACAGHADEQINQLRFRYCFEQGCQKIILFVSFYHELLLWKLKLNDLTQ